MHSNYCDYYQIFQERVIGSSVDVDRHANIACRVIYLCSRVNSKDSWRLQQHCPLTWSTMESPKKEQVIWIFDAFFVVIADILLNKQSSWRHFGTLYSLCDDSHTNQWLLRWDLCSRTFQSKSTLVAFMTNQHPTRQAIHMILNKIIFRTCRDFNRNLHILWW